MREQGVEEDLLSTVHAPIGIPIGGQTPKEIALSIMAEIVQVKNKEQPSICFETIMFEQLKETPPTAMAVIIEKKGSAPRGVGSRMLVGRKGLMSGSIGGGMIEHQVLQDIKPLIGTADCIVKNYQLNEKSAAALGMWCGGEVEVMMEGIPEKKARIKAETVYELFKFITEVPS